MNILKYNEYIKESKSSYDKYLKNDEFMNFFNNYKKSVFELYPLHSEAVLDLQIDTVYELYNNGYDIDSVIGTLYKTANVPTRD